MDTVPTPNGVVKIKQYFNPYKQFHGAMVPNWVLCREELSEGAKLCYARLLQFAGKDGLAYPSHATLARELGTSRRSIIRWIAELVEHELIESKQLGKKRTNRYFFLVHLWQSEGNSPVPEQTFEVPDLALHSDRFGTSIVIGSKKENQVEEDHSARNYVLDLKALFKSPPAGSYHPGRYPGPYLRKCELEGDLPDPFDVSAVRFVIETLSTAAREIYLPSDQDNPRLLFTVRSLPGLAFVADSLRSSPLRGEGLRVRMRWFAVERGGTYDHDTILPLISEHPDDFIRVLSK